MIIVAILLYIVCYLYCKYYGTLFNPGGRILTTPKGVREIRIKSGETNLVVWERMVNDRPLLLYFHGNNLNLTYRDYVVSLATILGLNLLLPDYRGFGKSGGYSTTTSLQEDSLNIYRHAISYGLPIILWGESLGGYAASYCLSRFTPSKLVLFSTFSDLRTMAPCFLRPLLSYFPPLDNEEYLTSFTGPALIIHSKEDSYIPFSQARRNLSLLKMGSILEIGGDHSTPRFTLENFESLVDFLGSPRPLKEDSLRWIEGTKKGYA